MTPRSLLLLSFGLLACATAANAFSCKVNYEYALAVDCTLDNVEAGTAMTIAWSRTDGKGVQNVTQTFSSLAQGSNTVTLFRFTPKQEYAITVAGQKTQYVTAGSTGVDEYDKDEPLVTISGKPTYEIMVVDRGGGLVGFDTYGWVVMYVKTANGAWDQFPAELGDYDLATLGAGQVTSSSGFDELSNLDQTVKSSSGDAFSSPSHEASVDYDAKGLPVLSLQSESKYFSGLSEE